MKLFLVLIIMHIISCTPKISSSKAKVVGGRDVTQDEFKAVVKYSFYYAEKGVKSDCTGTFITKKVLLTAAHCFQMVSDEIANKNKQLGFYEDGELVFTKSKYKLVSHSNYKKNLRSSDALNDIALIVFEEDFSEYDMELSSVKAQKGDEVQILGAGLKSFDSKQATQDNGVQVGRNKIDDIISYPAVMRSIIALFQPEGNKEDAVSAPGDSGGPMLLNNKIVGVVSRGDSPQVTLLANIHHKENMGFLKENGIIVVDGSQQVPVTPTDPGLASVLTPSTQISELCDYHKNLVNELNSRLSTTKQPLDTDSIFAERFVAPGPNRPILISKSQDPANISGMKLALEHSKSFIELDCTP